MLKTSICIASKDLKIVFSQSSGILQALLLGLLLIFIFSLSKNADEIITPQTAATIFWLASIFCQVLTFNMLYELETTNSPLTALLLMPKPVQAIFFGKMLAGLSIIILTQCIFLPATLIFLTQTIGPLWKHALLIIILIDIGLTILGSLIGGLSQKQTAGESILSIILFPLSIPLLFAGIQICTNGLLVEPLTENTSWIKITLAFDAIFLAVSLILFPFMITGDE